MSVLPQYQKGPITFEVSTAVIGGMMVESDGASPAKVQPASAGSKLCVGVATVDAVPTATSQTPTIPGYSGPSVNEALLPPYTSVAHHGVYPVVYAASAVFAALLKCAAGGKVTPWVDGTDDPAMIVGRCMEQAGVTSSGTTSGQTLIAPLGS